MDALKLNHHPTKTDVLPKNVVQFILAAKWLVRHSSTSPKRYGITLFRYQTAESTVYSKTCFIFLFNKCTLRLLHLWGVRCELCEYV